MLKNDFLTKSVKFALIGGAATAALAAPTVLAYEDEDKEKVERISVTGSRLKRTDLETATPITTIDAAQLKAQGIQDVGQYLQSSNVMSGSPAMTTTNNGGNGGTFVELRGLGSSRTLVLVNGRRPVSSDFQNIPASMIDRIEILKDGASATYGADAVAGVVNVITRKDFEGVEITLQSQNSFDVSEHENNGFSVVAGKAFDSGHFMVGLDYSRQKEVYQGDVKNVGFFQYPWQVYGEDAEKSFRNNGLIGTGDDANVIVVGSGSTPCGQFYLQHGPNQTNGNCDGGVATLEDMRNFVGGGPNNDTYNYAPVNYLQTPYTKFNIFLDGAFELNDSTKIYSETRINKRESRQELAAVPYDTNFAPGYKGTYGVTNEDGTPVLDDDGNQVMKDFNGVSKDNYYNPFGEDVLRSRRRMLEGGRSFEQDITRFQQVLGIEGEINDSWYYDVNYNYGYSQTVTSTFGQLYGPNLSKALGPSFQDSEGNVVCGTEDSPIADCVSMNVFGGPGSVTQEMLDYVAAPLVDQSNYTLQTLTAFVGGDWFELPGGMVEGGFGYEYRSEKLESQVDSGKFFGEVTGNKSKGTSGDFYVNSLFAEFNIPVVEGAPFAERIDIPVGVRYDDFDTFGGATTYQLGLEWDTGYDLLIRGTYGTVFRAPGISSLYGPGGDSFPSASDPCRDSNWSSLTSAQQGYCKADGVPEGGSGNQDGQQLAQVGGNPDLKPEEGDTFTFGFAYSPEFAEGLGLTVDYWAIEIEDVLDAVGANDSLRGCYLGGIASLCDNIRRTDGELSYISERTTNLSRMTAKGIDTEISYTLDALGGTFNSILSWTHFLERENQVYDSSTFEFKMKDLNGRFENDTSYATDKINLNVSYSLDDLSINYAMNYISGMQYDDLLYWGTTPVDPNDPNSPNAQYDIGSAVYHDISATYNFDTGTVVSAGISNLTDELPPYIEPAFNGNTDESTYRLFGRSWFLRVVQKF